MPFPRPATRARHLLLPVVMAMSLATASSAGAANTTRSPEEYRNYVALGDSFSSGPLIMPPDLRALGCGRSLNNYPRMIANRLSLRSLTDVSCGAAETRDLSGPQLTTTQSTVAPQFDALREDTDLVTLTIGGNDIGFGGITTECVKLSLINANGNPCEKRFTEGGVDQLAARIKELAPKLRAVFTEINDRSPNADIVALGYLRILPPQGGCFPLMPIAKGDIRYLNGVQEGLNRAIRTAAEAAGGTYVDTYQPTGHDVCQSPADKWVEGIVPTSFAYPVHPNIQGMAAMADMTLTALRDNRSDRRVEADAR